MRKRSINSITDGYRQLIEKISVRQVLGPLGQNPDLAIKPMMEIINNYCNSTEKTVLSLCFGLENGNIPTYKAISQSLNVSVDRVRQLEARTLVKLRDPFVALDRNLISSAAQKEQLDNSLELVTRTFVFATEKHQDQRRKGSRDIPYIIHPATVADLVAKANGGLLAVCAALLHDEQEDCGVTDEEITSLYHDAPEISQQILGIVKEHTDPPGMGWEEAKAREIQMMTNGVYSKEARVVIIADQTANMIDLVLRPPNWGGGEEQRYIELMEKLIDTGRGTSGLIESLFDDARKRARVFYGMSIADGQFVEGEEAYILPCAAVEEAKASRR